MINEPLEAQLLARINAPPASDARKVRDVLVQTRTERDLTTSEWEVLADAIDAVEMANADRWQAIADLAARRGLSLAEIARELEIPFPYL